MYQTAYAEKFQNYQEDLFQTYQEWLKSEFYRRVMYYLSDKDPKETLRDDYNANIENIYNKMKEEYKRFMWTLDELNKDREMQYILEMWSNMYEELEWNKEDKLKYDCKTFVANTDKLVRMYQREWIELEQDRDYDDLISCSKFNDWEQWEFIEHFVDPFLEKYPEYEEYADIVDEILREEMYNQDKYECIVL